MAGFHHGIKTIEVDSGVRSVTIVQTAVIGLVGTAFSGPINTPVLVSNERDFAQFGPAGGGSTIREALEKIFQIKPTVVLVVNVCDPAVHIGATVPAEAVNLQLDGTFALSISQPVSGVVVRSGDLANTYVEGVDYAFDAMTGKGYTIAGGGITASAVNNLTPLRVEYKTIDPTLASPADFIGGITPAGQRTGLKAFRDTFNLFGFYPKLLVAPGVSALPSVAAEMDAIAQAIRAFAWVDAPVGITPAQAIIGRGPNGAIAFNTSSGRVVLCYPHAKMYSTVSKTVENYPLSVLGAALQSKTDQEQGFWYSPSNKQINGVLGAERPIDALLNDPNSEANLLNAAGICTFFNMYGSGPRFWGNRTAAFPSNTSPKNFINIRRTLDVIFDSLEYYALQRVDQPITNAWIDAVLEDMNQFLRQLVSQGAILDGRAWFEKADNPVAALAAGQVTFTFEAMPPTVAELMVFKHILNTDALAQLGGGQ